MKTMLKKTGILLIALASLFVMSCADEITNSEKRDSSGKATLVFGEAGISRTILPTITKNDFKKLVLVGTYGGETKTLGNWASMADFENAKIDVLGLGEWTLTLTARTAETGGATYTDTKVVNVKAGTNDVSFDLSWSSLGEGNGTLNVDLTVPVQVKKAELVLSVEDFEPVDIQKNASSKIVYTNSTLPAGQYDLTVRFYGDDEEKAFINAVSQVVVIGGGFASSWTETFTDLNEVYEITYNLDGGTINGSYPRYFTRKSAFGLPTPVKAGHLFVDWYTDDAFTDANKVSSISEGSTGAKTFYAKWEEYTAPAKTSWDFTAWSIATKNAIIADSSWTQQPNSSSDSTLTDRYKVENPNGTSLSAGGIPIEETAGLTFSGGSVTISWDSNKGTYMQTGASITVPVEPNSEVTVKFANTGSKNGNRTLSVTDSSGTKKIGESGSTSEVTAKYTVPAGVNSITLVCSGGFNFYSIKGPVKPEALAISLDGATSADLKVGVEKTLDVRFTPVDVSNKEVNWTSSDNTAVTVVDGKITAIKEFTSAVTITATSVADNTKTATFTVNKATDTVKPTGISVTYSGSTTLSEMLKDTSKQLNVTFTPTNTEATGLTWTSSNPSAVSVDNGVIIAHSATTSAVTITATSVAAPSVKGIFTISKVVAPDPNTEKIFITREGGWLETAYAEWLPIKSTTNFNVYVKATTASSWTKVDKELIRGYASAAGGKTVHHYRVDALGLKAGTYQLKIAAVVNGTESTTIVGTTGNLTVQARDRNGYAHFNGGNPGAYKLDGTLKANTQIIYLTNGNKDTVTATCDGKTQTGIKNITQNAKKAPGPICIRVIGTVDAGSDGTGLSSADMASAWALGLKEAKNVTVEGVGEDAVIYHAGLAAFTCENIEFSNIGLMLWGGGKDGDGVSLKKTKNAWVHHLDIFYGISGGDADQAKGDGSMDLKDNSQYVTMDNLHFWDAGKMSLCGMKSESGPNWITYHHNWFDHSDSRHPRVRTMTVHVYNNYYDGNSKYGAGAAKSSEIFVEANYFRNCNYPMLISMQGSDTKAGGIFSGEDGGVIKSYANYMTGQKSYITYQQHPTEFDAWEATNRNDQVPSTVKAKQGGRVYSNFDTDNSKIYSYTPDRAADVKDIVTGKYSGRFGAGRMFGGDFSFTFSPSDDSSYSVNQDLMAALKAYKTALVSTNVGNGSITGGEEEDDPPTPGNPSLSLNKTSLSITQGGTATLTATLTNSSDTLNWTTNDATVATVTGSGSTVTVTATGAGTATITVTAGSLSKSCTVNVTASGGGGGGGSSVVYPTTPLSAGTFNSETKYVEAGFSLQGVDASKTKYNGADVYIGPSGAFAFYINKGCTLTFDTVGNKAGKIISSTGTEYALAKASNVSVTLPAGSYYITSADSTGEVRLKASITVAYTN